MKSNVGHAIACQSRPVLSFVWHAIACPTLVLLVACNHKTAAPANSQPAVKVQTLAVQFASSPNVVEVVGTVRARVTATIAAKITASVREVGVKPGDTITNGQVLAKLDDRVLRAEYERAKTDYDRYRVVQDKAAATAAEAEAAQMRFRVAEAALSDCQLVAPFTGQVTDKSCTVGDLVTPGKPLFTLEQPADFRLEVNVPESAAASLVIGRSINCRIEATGETCTGLVEEVIPAADPVTRTVLAKLSLKCQQPLKSGLFGRAQLPSGERRALFVPKSAIHERGQLTSVFIAEAGFARMRLVRTGKTQLDAVEILAGVQAGECVIVAGPVADGQPVSP